MPNIAEQFSSRLQNRTDGIAERSTATFEFIADYSADSPGAIDEQTVIDDVEDEVGLTYGTMNLHSTEIVERINQRIWRCRVKFIDVPAPTINYDFTAGTQHIQQSLFTVHSYGVGGDTPADNLSAIGYDGEHVQGVDKLVPALTWEQVHYWTDATLDEAAILALEGKINNGAFVDLRGNTYPTGSVLFFGAQVIEREDGLWEVRYKFGYSANKTGLTVGAITGITKDGWDYLWVRFNSKIDGTAAAKVQTPRWVYVERIYEFGDFSTLGI